MTVTASATDHDVVASIEGAKYPPARMLEASYTVPGRRGFHLVLERHGETWTVVDRETGIHGAGDTPTEAHADFMQAAQDHLDVLERQEFLSDDLAAQLGYLRQRIRAS